jgi:hypothetical protein
MEGFDPLFDDEPTPTTTFILSLPTFESQPPECIVPSTRNGTNLNIFDENVGNIALIGSPCSEQTLPFSNSSLDSTTQATAPMQQPRRQKQPRKRGPNKDSTMQRQHPPYRPTSAQDLILGQLAKDPNIVPLLQSIVEYIYRTKFASAQVPLPSKETDSSNATTRPTKKRRLNRVPAGAEDWVVPFPFQEGDGPLHYRETWEMKRLTLLLSGLMQSLQDWRRRSRSAPTNSRPREAIKRNSTCPATPSQEPSQTHDIPFREADFLSQMNIPNPSEFDSSLEALLNIFSTYDEQHDSALNVDLGALGTGRQISEILYTTPADAPQTVPWDQYLTFETYSSQIQASQYSASPSTPGPVSLDFDPDIAMVDVQQPSSGQYGSSGTCIDANTTVGDGYGDEATRLASGSFEQCISSLDPKCTGLGLDMGLPNLVHSQDVPMQEAIAQFSIEDILISGTGTSVPSLTASPSISMEPDLFQTTEGVQSMGVNNPRATPGISTLSKRGRARTTAVLRRDLKRSNRISVAEKLSEPSNGSQDLSMSMSPPNKFRAPKPQPRISESVLEHRMQLLEQAKEWRQMIAADLEKARTLGWEAMMEGIVLREADLILRNTSTN